MRKEGSNQVDERIGNPSLSLFLFLFFSVTLAFPLQHFFLVSLFLLFASYFCESFTTHSPSSILLVKCTNEVTDCKIKSYSFFFIFLPLLLHTLLASTSLSFTIASLLTLILSHFFFFCILGTCSSENSEPEIISTIPNMTVAVGREARIPCAVKNLGSYRVSSFIQLS